MEALQLVKNENTEVEFLAGSKILIFKLKGIVSRKYLQHLRTNALGMFDSLGVKSIVMNTTDSEYQEIDFSDEERKEFYLEAHQKGIRELKIIYPHQNFISEIQNQWSVFFKSNNIQIDVSASLS